MKCLLQVAVPALIAAFAAPGPVVAQAYPTKPVRVIVVFPPGGSNDVTARIVFQKMPEIAGQQFIVDNRGGASGTIGAAIVAKSPADGYTVMVQSTTHIANAFAYKGKLPYDTLGDFIGVTPLARQVAVLVVHPSMPVQSVKDLIALAKKRSGEINYGSAGLGSFVHLNMVLFTTMTKTNMAHVPYRGGGPLSIAMIAGEVQVTTSTIGSVFRHIESGKMRPLGVTSPQRVKLLPKIPAIAESVPGFEFTAWVGSFVPAGTPKPVVDKLNADLKKALADPDVANKLSSLTLDPMYMAPEQFAERLKADYVRYEKLMKQIGLLK